MQSRVPTHRSSPRVPCQACLLIWSPMTPEGTCADVGTESRAGESVERWGRYVG